MKHFTKNGLLAAASTLLLSSANTFANEYDVNQLIGKFYIGGHAQYFSADDDRMKYRTDPVTGAITASSLDTGDGFGLEAGYRYSAHSEFRLSATDLSVDADRSGFGDTDGSAIAFDYLYFPYQESLYLVAGLNKIDLDNDELSADLGLGYRHYFKQNLAFYAEAKTHFQFDESYKDFSAQIGLIYFFGDFSSPAPKAAQLPAEPVKAAEPAPAKVAAAPVDTDGDGVFDSSDNCDDTPAGDKVDAQGCTIFTEVASTLKLLINFDNNKADVNSDYFDEVEKAVALLNKYPHINLTIEGHSSAQGSAKYNKTLSQKRADAVVALMVEKYNVDADRLSAVGYGEERLINSDNTSAAHAENRRIEAVIEVVEKVAEKK